MFAGSVAISEGGHSARLGIQFNATGMMNADTIRQLIEQGLPGARARVQGEDGVHFEATVICDAFRGKLPLARHRMVYATLGERMGGEIHALALKTLAPDEAA